jgi:hypothetical protein
VIAGREVRRRNKTSDVIEIGVRTIEIGVRTIDVAMLKSADGLGILALPTHAPMSESCVALTSLSQADVGQGVAVGAASAMHEWVLALLRGWVLANLDQRREVTSLPPLRAIDRAGRREGTQLTRRDADYVRAREVVRDDMVGISVGLDPIEMAGPNLARGALSFEASLD